MMIDSHAHLNDQKFDGEVDVVVENAMKNGVKYIIINGYDIASSKRAIELANQYECIYATVGIHPLDIESYNEDSISTLRKLAKEKKVVAIGEIGLDYYYDKTKKVEQTEIFKLQLALAKELDMPVTIHSRDALNDTYEVLKESGNKGVMHCYSGSSEYAKKFVDLGFYISLAGVVTFKNAVSAKEVAKEISLSKLLVETDCPYLTPHPYRGKRNEPAYVKYVVEEIADIKSVSIEEVAKQTSANAIQLFNL